MNTPVTLIGCLGAGSLAGLRWLRVAQREHYLAPWTTTFARRWWTAEPANLALVVVGGVAVGVAVVEPLAGLVAAAVAAVGPVGLGIKGRTSPLAWTRRLRTTAAASGAAALTLVGAGSLAGAPAASAAAVVMGLPLVIDATLVALAPLERRAARRFVDSAQAKLREIDPTVVAITGSYGKTTTKGLVRHLVSASRTVVASPASFNNTAGLSRTMNEHLTPGTQVVVAEMGMYGPGEIRSLCAWVRPDISVITAIGPVHLERVGSIEGIVAAKSEILENARVAVLNIDAVGLAEVAEREAAQRRVIRVSCHDRSADVTVEADPDQGLRVLVGGQLLLEGLSTEADASNLACALGVVIALDIEPGAVLDRLADLPGTEHRRQVSTSEAGVTIIDDTYNANPAGAAAALDRLAALGRPDRRRVVVTPGMIELGDRQEDENRRFAARAAQLATHLIVVGRHNRSALVEGAAGGSAELIEVGQRDEAVRWVRSHCAGGDVVLYENDLPDHFP